MITRVGLAPRRPGMTTAAFLEHWRTAHADAAGAIPGLRRYVQYHPVLVRGVHPLGYPGFDAYSELDFDSVEAMDRGFASDVYRGRVRADEQQFVDKTRFSMVVGERRVLAGPQDDVAGVLLVTFLRRHPAASTTQLWAAIEGPYARAVEVDGVVTGHRVVRPLDVEREGRERAACDAIDQLSFADVDTALRWARSERAVTARLTLAGVVFGDAAVVVAGHVVV